MAALSRPGFYGVRWRRRRIDLIQRWDSARWKTEWGWVVQIEGTAERAIRGVQNGEGWAGRWPVGLEEVELWKSLSSLMTWGQGCWKDGRLWSELEEGGRD